MLGHLVSLEVVLDRAPYVFCNACNVGARTGAAQTGQTFFEIQIFVGRPRYRAPGVLSYRKGQACLGAWYRQDCGKLHGARSYSLQMGFLFTDSGGIHRKNDGFFNDFVKMSMSIRRCFFSFCKIKKGIERSICTLSSSVQHKTQENFWS